jgi:hypothetical protein
MFTGGMAWHAFLLSASSSAAVFAWCMVFYGGFVAILPALVMVIWWTQRRQHIRRAHTSVAGTP